VIAGPPEPQRVAPGVGPPPCTAPARRQPDAMAAAPLSGAACTGSGDAGARRGRGLARRWLTDARR
jgi:hypothetical protein